jgi:hypothetical protein
MDKFTRNPPALAVGRFNGLIGYVKGNRHNYLLELCQALKEAGRSRYDAALEIVTWAQRHGDEDRSYIVDLVYGKL